MCHGDLQGNFNTNFCDDNTYTHFDFDLCGYGWRAYDLAAFKLSRILIEEDDELVGVSHDRYSPIMANGAVHA
ncbi:hypothetical protein [Brevibacillus sp. FIR094]|uniref:hypothetical protein n=1 Tax=Brevibacillus sp. FIR094 TaxID=3134809 RepID=UPI003D1BCDE9